MVDIPTLTDDDYPVGLAVDDTHGPKAVTVVATALTTFIAAPGVGKSIYVTSITASIKATTITRLSLVNNGDTRESCFLNTAGGPFTHVFTPTWQLVPNTPFQTKMDVAPTGGIALTINYFVQ